MPCCRPPRLAVGPLAAPAQLVYAPDIEVNRPVFLLVRTRSDAIDPATERGMLYRSGDGGLTWQAIDSPKAASATALAISPRFSEDGLLFVGTEDGQVRPLDGGD